VNAPASVVDWMLAEIEARREEIESDFNGVDVGDLSAHFNRRVGAVKIETRISRTYPPRKTDAA
jgi:hypothetical protein